MGTRSPPSGPPGRPPGGPPAPSPPPGGPPPPWNGFHTGGYNSSSVHLNTLLKLVASLVLTSELVWVTMVGGSYARAKCVFQAELGVGRGF